MKAKSTSESTMQILQKTLHFRVYLIFLFLAWLASQTRMEIILLYTTKTVITSAPHTQIKYIGTPKGVA